jgi:hypothetical protein
VALQQYFSHSRLVIYFFPTSPTKTGTAKDRKLLIATHLNQSNNLADQQQVSGFAGPFASLSILKKNAGPKLFC